MSNRYSDLLKRPVVWLMRFRHRCGYGVHSPFAFSFITDVVYEKTAYYCYAPLSEQTERLRRTDAAMAQRISQRVGRLLFRIANYRQPRTIVALGRPSMAADYMQCARRSAAVCRSAEALPPEADLLFVDCDSADEAARQIEATSGHLNAESILVLMGIHRSAAMKHLWQQLKESQQSGITFDLYYLGIVFLDHDKIKQHYIVNF